MGEKGYESRFVCKLCNKRYPCGKSLGGHMRSHVVANSAEFQEKVEFNLKKTSSFLEDETKLGESGYGLRENPKKTWRAVDLIRPPLPQDQQVCKQCGKGFQSLKALCGHMACHSEKDKGGMKDDHSWTSENDQKMVFDSDTDTESEEMKLRSRLGKSKRYKKFGGDDSVFNSVANNHGSSSVSEIDFVQDPKDVAMCLMLMSRDVSGNNCGLDSVVESSDNNSVVMETTKSSSIEMRIGRKKEKVNECRMMPKEEKMESSDSGYFLDECGVDSDASGGEVRKRSNAIKMLRNQYDDDDDDDDDDYGMGSKFGGSESRKRKYGFENQESTRMMKTGGSNNGEMCSKSQKKNKYECFNCKKIFKSYQALGGHRPCHKKMNESRDEIGENNPYDSSTYSKKMSAKNTEKNSKSKKNKEQVCPFCNRVFKNGQALGGHKRSHFIGGHDDDNSNRSPVEKPELPDLLDLNLPAPEADEDD